MKRTNGGAQWWSEDKSFYAVLLLCLAAIAAAAYLLFAFPSGSADETMQAEDYQADDSVTASEALERIPAMDPQPAEKQESDTQTEEKEQTEQPVQQTAAALTVTPPMDSKITQDFSDDTLTYNETTGDWRTHEAVDYAGKAGDAVHAAADGTVLAVGEDAVLGNYLTISHAQGLTSLYAGIADPAVSEGDTVTQGQQIAVLGDPMPLEEKQGVHLHFALSVDEVQKNPAELY